MSLFLAQFTLVTQHYPDREEECPGLIRLIEADTTAQAHAKLAAHYAAKDDPYCVSYTVEGAELSEVIR